MGIKTDKELEKEIASKEKEIKIYIKNCEKAIFDLNEGLTILKRKVKISKVRIAELEEAIEKTKKEMENGIKRKCSKN